MPTIVQSAWGAGKRQAPVSAEAGNVVCETYEFYVNANIAAGDIVEIAVLPSYHTVVDAVLVAEDFTGGTANVGLMSGAVSSTDESRTVGNELFEGAALGDPIRMTKADGFLIKPVEGDRSIGITFPGGVTAAGQRVVLILSAKQ